MDALNRTRIVFWRLLRMDSAVVPIALALFYVVAALLAALMGDEKRGFIIATMSTVPAIGFAPLFYDRMARCCLAASALGVPDHERTMRDVQVLVVLIFVGLPLPIACLYGSAFLPAAAQLAGGFGFGLLLAMYRQMVFVIFLGIYAFRALVGPIWDWFLLPPVQMLFIVLSAVVFWRWRLAPARLTRAAALPQGALADAIHERSEGTMGETFGEKPEKFRMALESEEQAIAAATSGLAAGNLSAESLGVGLGYSVRTSWRGVVRGVGVGLVVLAAWRALRGYRPEPAAYLCLCGFAALGLATRIQQLAEGWRSHAMEQSILILTQQWPSARRIKSLVLQSMLLLCRGTLVGWAAMSVIGVGLGLVQGWDLWAASIGSLAALCMPCGATWFMLSRRRIPRTRVSAIVIALSAIAGGALVVFGEFLTPYHVPWGLALILVPAALAFAKYWWGPLRLPVDSADDVRT